MRFRRQLSASPVAAAGPDAARIPALDGLRGIAILSVVVLHYSTVVKPVGPLDGLFHRITDLGGYGVTLFFVLSGFLITGILVDAKGKRGYFRFFYARRVLRIFPLYYLLLTGVWLAWALSGLRGVDDARLVNNFPLYWLYLSNIAIAQQPVWTYPTLDVTWSLAIEEQFYLLWPAVVLLCSRGRLAVVCFALIALAIVWRVMEYLVGPAETFAALTPRHLDALAAGALVALAVRQPEWFARVARRLGWPQLAAGIGVVALIIWPGEAAALPLVVTLLVLFFALTLARAVSAAPRTPLRRALERPWLRAFGTYSYAIYLFHQPVSHLVLRLYPAQRFPTLFGSQLPGLIVFLLLSGAVAFGVGWLSWHVVEKRILGLRRLFVYGSGGQRSQPRPQLAASASLPSDVS